MFLFANDNNMEEKNITPTDDESKKNTQRNQNRTYFIKKRPPVKPLQGDNVIFVTRKTNFKAQLDKCFERLTRGEKEIILHGLGAAIQRCCNLAIQLQLLFPGTHEIEINTGTIDIVDDVIPLIDDLAPNTQIRLQSSVHIRIFRTAMTSVNQ